MTALAHPEPAAVPALPAHARVVVVGAGFAGLATAISLRRSGRHDFVVVERGDDVGGAWRDNTYPGCACDVPSHLYSFSFAPNPGWSRTFSPQPEIQAYLQRVAREAGVLAHIRFGTELLEARWDSAADAGRWRLTTSRGAMTADVLVLGTGGLSEPSVPDLPGLADFAGTTFHSAAWDHDHDLGGRRVGVVGTGASAIQFIPHVQRAAAHLTVFQRTPPWILPRHDKPIAAWQRWLYERVPVTRQVRRLGIYGLRECAVVGFTMQPRLMALLEKQARAHLAHQVPDPALRARLTPSYRLGCKRILISNDYYPALRQRNVDVVTDRIERVKAGGVVTVDADGRRSEHAVDTLILGTGFRVTDPPIAHRLRGRDGRTLAQAWAGTGMSALRGLTIAGFPNLFLLVGPNTGLGHTSIVYMIESQVRYLLSALDVLDRERLASLEPRPEAQAGYTERLQRALAGTVWNAGGCASWYLDEHGRNTTLWPTFTFRFRRALRRVDLVEYDVVPRPVTASHRLDGVTR